MLRSSFGVMNDEMTSGETLDCIGNFQDMRPTEYSRIPMPEFPARGMRRSFLAELPGGLLGISAGLLEFDASA